jgi:predicted enzyme related to lactoylglutathione lyase
MRRPRWALGTHERTNKENDIMAYKHGNFVWFELLTGDVPGAKSFYPEVLGWGTKAEDMGDIEYTMLTNDGAPQAGMVKPPMQGVPNQWTSYLSVEDVDAAAQAVEKHGGRIIVPPTDIPNIGRFSTVADPQGATFNLFKGSENDDNASQAFHWNELWSKNAEEVLPFYEKALGVVAEPMDMPQGKYYLLKIGESSMGGLMTSPDPKVPAMWLPFIAVDDCDETVTRAKTHGGDVKSEPKSIDGIGRFSILADTGGAVVGVIAPAQAH